MLGQGPNWAPRLPYFYYTERIKETIQIFITLEKQLAKLQKKLETAEGKREIMTKESN